MGINRSCDVVFDVMVMICWSKRDVVHLVQQ